MTFDLLDLRQALAACDLSPVDLETIHKVIVAQADLLTQNWSQIRNVLDQDDDKKVVVSMGFQINTAGKRPQVITRIAFARKVTDEREDWVEDPEQIPLFEKEGAA